MNSVTKSQFISIFLFISLNLNAALPSLKNNVRVYGGNVAKPGQFPFIVAINDAETGHLCGGSILNHHWFVTAAHCTIHPNLEDYIIIGGTNLLDTDPIIYSVDRVIVHPWYNASHHIHDLALFRIKEGFNYTNLVQPIEIDEIEDNKNVTVIGWGATEYTKFPNELRYADVKTLSFDECTKLSQGGRYIYDRVPGQVCALASKGIAPCNGDSGGPLVYNRKLIGIVSYAIWPCANGYPDVYTRASYYSNWIMENVVNN